MTRTAAVDIEAVSASPEARTLGTAFDTPPPVPGLALDVTIRNPHVRQTRYVVADRSTRKYDAGTATLAVRLDPPVFIPQHHHWSTPRIDPLEPGGKRTVSIWVPLVYHDLALGQPAGMRQIDATGWEVLIIVIASGTGPIRPTIVSEALSAADSPAKAWTTSKRSFRRSELL